MFIRQPLKIFLLLFATVAADQQSTNSMKTHAKIVGGYPISIYDAPYQVSVRLRALHNEEYGTGHICGGTVISQRVICSAAHCFAVNRNNSVAPPEFREPENFVIVAGGSYVANIERFSMESLVQQLVVHEEYVPQRLENDIALVFLNTRITENYPTVRSLPLALRPYPPGTFCLISGWGNKARQLQQAVVPIMHSRLCSVIYMDLPLSQLCAGYLQGGADACIGDSGGPLVCNGTLAGIISWGIDCGRFFFPGVYTNVSHYIDWITKMNSSLDYSRYLKVRSLSGVSKSGPLKFVFYLLPSSLLTITIKVKANNIFYRRHVFLPREI